MQPSFTRRNFLRSTSALIALPALESLGFRRFASAAEAPAATARPKRAVILGFGWGVTNETWFAGLDNPVLVYHRLFSSAKPSSWRSSLPSVLAALCECGMESNTIVFFSADNGPEFYAYARDEKFDHWSAAPFRGLKRDIYEGGHHVPFVIKWPGVTKAGAVTDALISQVDLMATFAALVKFDLPSKAAEDSFNFLPWLQGETKMPPRSTMVHNTTPEDYAIRDGDWLLVDAKSGYASHKPSPDWNKKHNQPPDDAQPVELFNLKEDIGQRHNLAAEQPEKVAQLQALLKQIRDQEHSAPRLN